MEAVSDRNELNVIRKALINLMLLKQQSTEEQDTLREAENRVKSMVPGFDVYYVENDSCYVLFPYNDRELD